MRVGQCRNSGNRNVAVGKSTDLQTVEKAMKPSLQDCIDLALDLTSRTRCEYVVRNRGFREAPDYFVAPMFELGREGFQHDAGYAGLGTLVWRSGVLP